MAIKSFLKTAAIAALSAASAFSTYSRADEPKAPMTEAESQANEKAKEAQLKAEAAEKKAAEAKAAEDARIDAEKKASEEAAAKTALDTKVTEVKPNASHGAVLGDNLLDHLTIRASKEFKDSGFDFGTDGQITFTDEVALAWDAAYGSDKRKFGDITIDNKEYSILAALKGPNRVRLNAVKGEGNVNVSSHTEDMLEPLLFQTTDEDDKTEQTNSLFSAEIGRKFGDNLDVAIGAWTRKNKEDTKIDVTTQDRKSTRLNSSH